MRARDFIADIEKMFDQSKDKREMRYIEDRPKLTLRKLNAIRKMREVNKMKRAKQAELVQKMYGDSDDDSKKD